MDVPCNQICLQFHQERRKISMDLTTTKGGRILVVESEFRGTYDKDDNRKTKRQNSPSTHSNGQSAPISWLASSEPSHNPTSTAPSLSVGVVGFSQTGITHALAVRRDDSKATEANAMRACMAGVPNFMMMLL
jgi:hypothetical protein